MTAIVRRRLPSDSVHRRCPFMIHLSNMHASFHTAVAVYTVGRNISKQNLTSKSPMRNHPIRS